MSIKIFKKGLAVKRDISPSHSVFNLLTAKDSERLSLGLATTQNHLETTTTHNERVYYVLEGKMIVNKEIHGEPGDVILISTETEYTFQGTFKAIVINSPPYKK